MREPAQPNFFIVGAGKAGTTSLYHYLGQHPQIYMSRVKEPSYFASEVRGENLSPSFLRHIERQSRLLRLRDLLGDGKPLRPAGWLVSEWEEFVLYVSCTFCFLEIREEPHFDTTKLTVNCHAHRKCRISCHPRRHCCPTRRFKKMDQSVSCSDCKFHVVGV